MFNAMKDIIHRSVEHSTLTAADLYHSVLLREQFRPPTT